MKPLGHALPPRDRQGGPWFLVRAITGRRTASFLPARGLPDVPRLDAGSGAKPVAGA